MSSQQDRCSECNGELSYCGDMTSDGPSLDCRVCQLESDLSMLRSELARVKEAAELFGVAFAYGLPTDKPTTDDARRFARSCEAVMNNPTAAALVEQSRKENA